MPRHTPGPWRVVISQTSPICYIHSNDGQIASTYGERDFHHHQLPDAYLIAAAPALLDICKRLIQIGTRGDITKGLHDWVELLCDARAALAQAKGESDD